jgi:hypothetical protein
MSNELAVKNEAPVTPMGLLQAAQSSGASIEQMQQLMDLQERYEARESLKAFNQAMSAFRDEAPTINRSRKGHNTKYAGLAETIEAIKPLLSKHGLSHQWKTKQDGSLIAVECTVTHRMGHSESTTLSAEPDKTGQKNSIQAIGSTVAYLERYTLYAILGLASREMDDDGGGSGEPVLNDEQLANVDALIAETGTDVNKFCTFMKVNELPSIKAKDYVAAVRALEAKRRK